MEKRIGKIYIIHNRITNKKYIGQTVMNVRKRWNKHVSNAKLNKNNCNYLEQDIRKFGKDNFEIKVMLICEREQLDMYEYQFINMYNTQVPNGYNLMSGGQNRTRKHHHITKKQMSMTRTGKNHTEQTKQKISEAHIDRIVTLEHRINIGESSKYRNMKSETVSVLDNFLKKQEITTLPIYVSICKGNKYYGFTTTFPKSLNIKNRKSTKYPTLEQNFLEVMNYYQFHYNGHRS